MTDIPSLLQALADLRLQEAALLARKAAALPASVRKALAANEARFAPELATVQLGRTVLESDIKTAVLAHGASVQSAGIQAVYISGRVSWNDDALLGYASTHAELMAFRTLGTPSVSLRTVKEHQ